MKESWEDFVDNRRIRYELVAIDEDTEEVVSKFTSHIDAADVSCESDNMQKEVDEHLRKEFDVEPDYDEIVKDERVLGYAD